MASTLKKEIIKTFAFGTDIDLFPGNSIILVTAAGLICGTLPEEEPTGDKLSDAHIHIAMITAAKEKHKSENDELSGNDGFLTLEDVTIRSGNKVIATFGGLTVFYDQIIGVALGKLPEN